MELSTPSSESWHLRQSLSSPDGVGAHSVGDREAEARLFLPKGPDPGQRCVISLHHDGNGGQGEAVHSPPDTE